MPVQWSDLEDAYVFLSGDGSATAFVNTKTGEIFLRSDLAGIDELPEDAEDSGDYLELPSRRDLELGTRLVMAFARDELPEHYDEIDGIFSRKGAYRRLKDFLERIGRLQAWYDYEEAATEKALREWCAEQGIDLQG
ncbi:MAG: hypothetical protein ACLPN5_14590 [Roseiarcus sp.]